MKVLRVLPALFVVVCLSFAANYCLTQSKESKGATVRGKIMFSDYYSMGGEKCAAFLETPDGEIICVLDNMNTADLKGRLDGRSGHVRVTGTFIEDARGKYLKLEEYKIMEEAKPGFMEKKIPLRERVGPSIRK
ncbi:MAG: hypothetical protein PVH45_01335 [Candidatus Omnitrophota bacterium]|jgi:hypothetical protein